MFCVDKSLPFWRVLINDKDTHCLRFWSCIHTLERVSTWSFGETVLRWSHGWLNNSIIDAYGCHLFSIVLIELCICFWILLSVPRTIEITNRPPPEPLDQVKPQHIRPIYGIGRRPFFRMWLDTWTRHPYPPAGKKREKNYPPLLSASSPYASPTSSNISTESPAFPPGKTATIGNSTAACSTVTAAAAACSISGQG
jgi:hypothetical protein